MVVAKLDLPKLAYSSGREPNNLGLTLFESSEVKFLLNENKSILKSLALAINKVKIVLSKSNTYNFGFCPQFACGQHEDKLVEKLRKKCWQIVVFYVISPHVIPILLPITHKLSVIPSLSKIHINIPSTHKYNLNYSLRPPSKTRFSPSSTAPTTTISNIYKRLRKDQA